MRKKLAFVLGGGGSRGALQVGALRALLEAGFRPQMLVGTSIGAVNATFLALRGLNPGTLDELRIAWQDAAAADLLPSNYLWLTVRTLFGRSHSNSFNRMREFFINHGLSPKLRFKDIHGVELLVVAADLNSGKTIVYGLDPEQLVLDGLLASTALPPWVSPLEIDGKYLVDGGVISTLSIETALAQGATEIVALDLGEPRDVDPEARGFGQFLGKLIQAVEQRQTDMELALAEARGVPVFLLSLLGEQPVPIWDFQFTDELIQRGYEIARQEISRWKVKRPPRWLSWLRGWRRPSN